MKKNTIIFVLLLSNVVLSQKDSLKLNPIIIEGYNFYTPWVSTPTNALIIDSNLLQLNHGISPADALNSIPSVRFDERGIDGSRRISIRGSSLRSPFGVRNIKFYWNNIPFSSPDGSTGLEVLDTRLVDKIEVLKGPTASLYGAGMGGVLVASTNPNANEVSLETTIGSSNIFKQALSVSLAHNKWSLKIGGLISNNAGYREQEANAKIQAFIATNFKLNHLHEFHLLTNIYKGKWGLPGAIDSLSVINNPKQAVAFAKENNTRVERTRLRSGIGHTYKNGNIKVQSSIYGNTSSKLNPYGTSAFFNGYKDEYNLGFGGRIIANYKTFLFNIPTDIIGGAEFQYDDNDLTEFDLINGSNGLPRYNELTNSNSTIIFSDVRLTPVNWVITFGGSINQLKYSSKTDLLNNTAPTELVNQFTPIYTPKVSLLYKLNRRLSFYSNYTKGYNPPTIWDIKESDSTLAPEIGENIEFGLKYNHYKRVQIAINYFHLNTKNAIVSTQQPGLNFILTNAGQTLQQGIETSIKFNGFQQEKWQLTANATHTFSKYIFKNYINNGDNFNGKHFPGVPKHSFLISTAVNSPLNVYLSSNFKHEGEVFLSDENTVTQNQYGLLSCKIGWRKQVNKFSLDASILGTNLTNTVYSSFLQLNGFGGRFFNPSPARDFFGNIKIQYVF